MTYKTTNYDAVQVDEYMGKYSISSHRVSNDKVYANWARYQTKKDEFNERAWPVKVVLGEKEMAIATLKAMIKEIENPGEEDIHF